MPQPRPAAPPPRRAPAWHRPVAVATGRSMGTTRPRGGAGTVRDQDDAARTAPTTGAAGAASRAGTSRAATSRQGPRGQGPRGRGPHVGADHRDGGERAFVRPRPGREGEHRAKPLCPARRHVRSAPTLHSTGPSTGRRTRSRGRGGRPPRRGTVGRSGACSPPRRQRAGALPTGSPRARQRQLRHDAGTDRPGGRPGRPRCAAGRPGAKRGPGAGEPCVPGQHHSHRAVPRRRLRASNAGRPRRAPTTWASSRGWAWRSTRWVSRCRRARASGRSRLGKNWSRSCAGRSSGRCRPCPVRPNCRPASSPLSALATR